MFTRALDKTEIVMIMNSFSTNILQIKEHIQLFQQHAQIGLRTKHWHFYISGSLIA